MLLGIFSWIFGTVGNFFYLFFFFALIPIYLFFLLKEMNNIEQAIIDHVIDQEIAEEKADSSGKEEVE